MEKKVIILVITISLVAMMSSGCSLIMFGLGSLADASQPDSVYVPGCPVDTLRLGTTIYVIKTDGDTVSGKFIGTDPKIQSYYWEETYSAAHKSDIYDSTQIRSLMIRCRKDTTQISIDEIEGILWYPKKNNRKTLLVIGACVDGLIIYGLSTTTWGPTSYDNGYYPMP